VETLWNNLVESFGLCHPGGVAYAARVLLRLYRYRLYRYLPIWVVIGIVPAWLGIEVLLALLVRLVYALTG
jgi:hypothetical protein